MPSNVRSVIVEAGADAVWGLVRDFNGLATWSPAMTVSVIEDGLDPATVGCVRRFDLGNGGVARERLTALDDVARSYTYTLVEAPFPARDYLATLSVTPVADGGPDRSLVAWSNTYDCDPSDEKSLAATFGDHIFAPALAALRDRFAS
ncbi:MAG TPA: SRPBCC family protein [Streptosporangiaceae bacterium]|jgi:hypothetical protein